MWMRGFTVAMLVMMAALAGAGCSHTTVHNPTGATTVNGGHGVQNNVDTHVKIPVVPGT